MHKHQNTDSIKFNKLPSSATLLKISIGLIFVAILSQAFVFAETMSVIVNGESHDVNYSVNGMSVTSIEADLDFVSLIFTVDVTSDTGTLQVTFDRSFFDAKYQGIDDEFIVLADGDEPKFSEIQTTSQSRTLEINLPAGTEEVEIIGTVFNPQLDEISSDSEVQTESEPEPTNESQKQIPAPFVDPLKNPKYYVERYVTESSYKKWFEDNYADYSFYEALGITKSEFDQLVIEINKEQSETETSDTDIKPEENNTIECGEGTILRDGVCVLEERCGPGTILKDGICVVSSQPTESVSTTSLGKELGYGVIAAFIITGAIAIILALMSKASKSRN